jgi:hypothetical protein
LRTSAERDQLQARRQDLQVRALLGEVAPSDDGTDLQVRLDELEASLAVAQARVSPLGEALRRLESREPEIRAAVVMEMRGRIRVAADAIVAEMAALLRQVAAKNAELVRLEQYGLGNVPAPSWREFRDSHQGPSRMATWLRTAREAGVDI